MTRRRQTTSSADSQISRRDFFLGRYRFWRRPEPTTAPIDFEGVRRKVNAPPMRYPRSAADVIAGNVPSAAPSDAPEQVRALARRRVIPVLRPPGAIEETRFLAGCTRCEACIVACPHQAIVHAPLQLREAAGTPMIDADRQPCLMCADFPCIAACEPGVLSPLVPPVLGTARITAQLCVAHHGQPCDTCRAACPVEQVIRLTNGKPEIDERRCTGCGVCRFVCPAPANAILLMPVFVRPQAP